MKYGSKESNLRRTVGGVKTRRDVYQDQEKRSMAWRSNEVEEQSWPR